MFDLFAARRSCCCTSACKAGLRDGTGVDLKMVDKPSKNANDMVSMIINHGILMDFGSTERYLQTKPNGSCFQKLIQAICPIFAVGLGSLGGLWFLWATGLHTNCRALGITSTLAGPDHRMPFTECLFIDVR